jgi:hypothetical protein
MTIDGGVGGLFVIIPLRVWIFWYSGVRGGGKCPEEEHTTCSGGPTINCHKRGLWGERNLGCKNKKYYIKNIIFYRNKI